MALNLTSLIFNLSLQDILVKISDKFLSEDMWGRARISGTLAETKEGSEPRTCETSARLISIPWKIGLMGLNFHLALSEQ